MTGPRTSASGAQDDPGQPGPATPDDHTAAPPGAAGPAGGAQAAIAAYARACLASVRPERDWFRAAVTKLEAAGERIVQTEQPAGDATWWRVLDWRTGERLAEVAGGHDDYDAAWQPGWTDTAWIGSWIERLATDGTPAPDWPDALPPPPDPADLTGRPRGRLDLEPASLAALLEDTIETWALDPYAGRTAEVAELAGWTQDQVLACAGSYLTMTGEKFMALGGET